MTTPLGPARAANPMVVTLVLFCLGMLLLMVGAFLYPPLHDLSAAFDWTISIGVLLGLIAVLSFLLRERKNVLLLLVLVCFFLVPTALALAVGGVMTLNGALDESEPGYHAARVLDTNRFTSSRMAGFVFRRVQLESWRPGEPNPWIEVEESLYESVTPGTSVVGVVTKPGWMGVEWVLEIQIESDEGSSRSRLHGERVGG